MPGTRAIVLLAEDNETDIELTQLSLEQSGFTIELHVVRDGEQCLAFLRRHGSFAGAPRPDLLLLDLHMPRMSGLEVLDAINADAELRQLPTVVLTTSDSESDVRAAYARRCSGYLVKPMGFSEFATAIRALMAYWFTIVVLPTAREKLP